MVKVCKYQEQNIKERKCLNYFISHSKGSRHMCRLSEWKKKHGVCPYDSLIRSEKNKSQLKEDPNQKKLDYEKKRDY